MSRQRNQSAGIPVMARPAQANHELAGEKALLVAILSQAITDLSGSREGRGAAEHFFIGHDGTFQSMCEALGMCPEAVQERIAETVPQVSPRRRR